MKKTICFCIEKRAGVYRLQNLQSGKFYIGSSKNLYNRYYSHVQLLQEKRHENIRIKEDCDKFGSDSFVFGVVEYCNEEEMKNREQYYFELWKPQYNVWKNVYSANGREYTEEQLKKLKEHAKSLPVDYSSVSEKRKQWWVHKKQSPDYQDYLAKISKKGLIHSEETKKKMSLIRKGKKKPDSFSDKVRNRRLGTKLINGHYVKVQEKL